jgi:hypothetical protein
MLTSVASGYEFTLKPCQSGYAPFLALSFDAETVHVTESDVQTQHLAAIGVSTKNSVALRQVDV